MLMNKLKVEVLLSEEKSFSLARKASMHPTTFSAEKVVGCILAFLAREKLFSSESSTSTFSLFMSI